MAFPTRFILYTGNDQVFELDGLADFVAGTSINSATVTITLKDSTGAIVTGVNALVLAYVAASVGIYRGTIANTFNPPLGGGYTMNIDATNSGSKLHIEVPAEVRVRKS